MIKRNKYLYYSLRKGGINQYGCLDTTRILIISQVLTIRLDVVETSVQLATRGGIARCRDRRNITICDC